MKVFRAILTILGCALIVLGGYSAVTFLMQRDFAPVQEPTVEAPQPAEPEQPEKTPEEPTQPAEDPELEARHSRKQSPVSTRSLSPVRRRRILWAAAPSAGSSTAPIT